MKNLLKDLTILIAFFIIHSCENKDDNPIDGNFIQSVIHHDDIKYEEITFDQFIQNEASETLIPLSSHLDINNQSKSSSSEDEDKFTIRTDHVKKIVKDGYASYTFMIEDNDKEDNVFENLVIHKLDSIYKYYKIQYTKEEEVLEFPYTVSYMEIDKDNLDLNIFSEFLKSGNNSSCMVARCFACSEGHSECHGPEPTTSAGWDGPLCSGTTTLVDLSACGTTGGTENNTEDGPNTTSDGNIGVGGGGGGPNGPGGPTTSPTDPGQEDTSEMDEFNANRISNLGVNFTPEQTIYLISNANLIGELEGFIDEDNSQEAKDATAMLVEAIRINRLTGPYNSTYYSAINPYADANLTDPATYALWAAHFSAQCAILKFQNPTWSNTRVYWEASKEMIHIALDIGGMVPAVGIVCDLVNGAMYTIEGDGLNATLSFVAAIPIVGWWPTGAKYATKVLTLASGSRTTLKWIVKANGLIDFGRRSQLRKVLQLAVGSAKQAHHIIPWAKQTQKVVQQAAKYKKAFHMNEALNGIPLDKLVHNGSHPLYDARVQARMQELINTFGDNITPQQAYDGLVDIISDIRTAISNNPGTHIENLIF